VKDTSLTLNEGNTIETTESNLYADNEDNSAFVNDVGLLILNLTKLLYTVNDFYDIYLLKFRRLKQKKISL